MKSGHPRASTEVENNMAEDVVNTADEVFIKDIHETLGKQNVNISKRTLRHRQKEKGYRYMPVLSKPLLTHKHMKQRYQWALSMQDQDWDHVIAADETTIRLNSRTVFSWQKTERRALRRVVQFPVKINVWGRLSSKYFGKIRCFNENLNSNFLCNDIYRTCLLPTARKH